MNGATTMTEARIKVWTTKTGRKTKTKVPNQCCLPPTSEVFEGNVKRVHFQCATWRKALQESPNLDPTEYVLPTTWLVQHSVTVKEVLFVRVN